MAKNGNNNKKPSRKKTVAEPIWADDQWVVREGKLIPTPGRPDRVKSLFSAVAEKIPFDALGSISKEMKSRRLKHDGVYIAHDSMGFARYVGRGSVFARLRARRRKHPNELKYFSFYIVANKKHEREIETLMVRLGGAHLQFNTAKKRVDVQPGSIRDYEPGTRFFERQRRPGPKKKTRT